MKNQNKNIKLSLALLLFVMLALTPAANAAQIWTNQEDYGPDEIVYITGTGFDINSVITVTIVGPEEWGMDQFDSLNSPWWAYWSFTEPDSFTIGYLKVKCLGEFTVTATDGTNTATTTFTDGDKTGPVTIGPQSGPLTSGTAGSVTYTVTVSKIPASPGSITVALSITTVLPIGASASWSVNPLTISGGAGATAQSTLTINTTVGTPAGSTNFTVKAENSTNDYSMGDGSLVISEPGIAPSITSHPSSATKVVGESVTFSVTASGTSPLSYQWRKNGTDIIGATNDSYTISSVVITDAADYDVVVSNAYGFATSNIATLTVNPASDTTPPDTQILSQPTDPTNSDSASFTWTGSDNVTLTANLVYSYQLDGGGWSGWASSTSTTYSSLADGPHTFEVKAKDEAENEDLTPASWTWNIDATPPMVTNIIVSDTLINEADDGGTFDVTVTFSEAMDTSATPIISFIPDMASTLTSPSGSWSVGNTVYTVSYTIVDADVETDAVDVSVSGAQDLVGNLQDPDPTIVTDLFDVDTIAPTVTIDIPDYINIANVASVPVTITSDEDGDYAYEISDGAILLTGTGSITGGIPVNLNLDLSTLADGPVTADASVEDAAENVGYAPQDTATKDTIAPNGSITINGDLPYTNTVNVTLNLEATDASGVDAYRVADGTDATAGSPVLVGPDTDYDEDVPWTLPNGSGVKTVAVQYRDAAGNWSENYTDSIMLIEVLSAVTAGGCPFDKDEGLDGQQFRLIFTQDPTNISTYKVTATNPGQFFYNIFYIGTPGESVTLNTAIDSPFVTQGAMPVHVYANVSFDGDCFVPADEIAVLPALSDNSPNHTITVDVPDTGLVYVRIHLDYGLKKDVGYTRDASNNAEKPLGTDVILDLTEYEFAVSGGMDDSVIIQNQNVFKKIPGFGGMVTDGLGGPIYPVNVTIIGPGVNATVSTDEDGFYFLYYKHKGKEATFTVGCSSQSETVYMRANRLIQVDFEL
jgi:hypothetical protein